MRIMPTALDVRARGNSYFFVVRETVRGIMDAPIRSASLVEGTSAG